MSSVRDKMSASTSTYPACFTLPETLAIIRAGGKNTLADLLEANAGSTPAIPTQIVDYTALATAVATAVTAALRPLISEVRTIQSTRQGRLSLPVVSPNGDYYTIKAYGSLRGMRVNKNTAVTLGREASRLSRERNIEIKRVSDEEWGEINSYHMSILKEVFTL